MQANGNFAYVAASDQPYEESFDVSISNGTEVQTATIGVSASDQPFGGNQIPTVVDVSYVIELGQTLDTAQDTSGYNPGILVDDVSPDGSLLTVTAVDGDPAEIGTTITLASGATLTMQADGNFTYVPLQNGPYADYFFVSVSSSTETIVAGVSISVTEPVLSTQVPIPTVQDLNYELEVGQTLDTTSDFSGDYPRVLLGDTDPNGTTLSVTAVNGDSSAIGQTITLASGATLTMQANGNFAYVAASGQPYNDIFEVSVSNGVQTVRQTVSMTVSADNSAAAPSFVVEDATYYLAQGETLNTGGGAPGVLSHDADSSGNALTVTAVNGDSTAIGQTIMLASGATLTMQADGNFTYVVASSESYAESFDITVSNGTRTLHADVQLFVGDQTSIGGGESTSDGASSQDGGSNSQQSFPSDVAWSGTTLDHFVLTRVEGLALPLDQYDATVTFGDGSTGTAALESTGVEGEANVVLIDQMFLTEGNLSYSVTLTPRDNTNAGDGYSFTSAGNPPAPVVLTGSVPVQGLEWHHLLPKDVFRTYGMTGVVNIQAAEFARMLPADLHRLPRGIHNPTGNPIQGWEQVWIDWFESLRTRTNPNPTVTPDMIRQQLARMQDMPQFREFFQPANGRAPDGGIADYAAYQQRQLNGFQGQLNRADARLQTLNAELSAIENDPNLGRNSPAYEAKAEQVRQAQDSKNYVQRRVDSLRAQLQQTQRDIQQFNGNSAQLRQVPLNETNSGRIGINGSLPRSLRYRRFQVQLEIARSIPGDEGIRLSLLYKNNLSPSIRNALANLENPRAAAVIFKAYQESDAIQRALRSLASQPEDLARLLREWAQNPDLMTAFRGLNARQSGAMARTLLRLNPTQLAAMIQRINAATTNAAQRAQLLAQELTLLSESENAAAGALRRIGRSGGRLLMGAGFVLGAWATYENLRETLANADELREAINYRTRLVTEVDQTLARLCQGPAPTFRRDGALVYVHIASGRRIDLSQIARMTPNRALLMAGRLAVSSGNLLLSIGMLIGAIPMAPAMAIGAMVYFFPQLFPSVIGEFQRGTAEQDAAFILDFPRELYAFIPVTTILGENPVNTWNRFRALASNLQRLPPEDQFNFRGRDRADQARVALHDMLMLATIPHNSRVISLIGQESARWWQEVAVRAEVTYPDLDSLLRDVQRNYMDALRRRVFNRYVEEIAKIENNNLAQQRVQQLIAGMTLPAVPSDPDLESSPEDYYRSLRSSWSGSSISLLLAWTNLGNVGQLACMLLPTPVVVSFLRSVPAGQIENVRRVLECLTSTTDRARFILAISQQNNADVLRTIPDLVSKLLSEAEIAQVQSMVAALGEEYFGGMSLREYGVAVNLTNQINTSLRNGTPLPSFASQPEAARNCGRAILPMADIQEARSEANGRAILSAMDATENATENRFELAWRGQPQVNFRMWYGHWYWQLGSGLYRSVSEDSATLPYRARQVREALAQMERNVSRDGRSAPRISTPFQLVQPNNFGIFPQPGGMGMGGAGLLDRPVRRTEVVNDVSADVQRVGSWMLSGIIAEIRVIAPPVQQPPMLFPQPQPQPLFPGMLQPNNMVVQPHPDFGRSSLVENGTTIFRIRLGDSTVDYACFGGLWMWRNVTGGTIRYWYLVSQERWNNPTAGQAAHNRLGELLAGINSDPDCRAFVPQLEIAPFGGLTIWDRNFTWRFAQEEPPPPPILNDF